MFPNLLALTAMMPCVFCTHYFIPRIVPIERPMFFSILGLVISCVLWTFNHILAPNFFAASDFLIYAADMILILCLVPRKKQPRFILIYVLFSAVQSVAAAVSIGTVSSILHCPPVEVVNPESLIYPATCLLATGISILIMYSMVHILKRILPPLHEKKILVIFSLLFFCQILLAYVSMLLYVYGKDMPGRTLMLGLTSVLYIAAGIGFLAGYRFLHQMDLEALQSKQAQQQLNLQTQYYQQLQENILQVNQIRHDLSNQLQAAYYLLEHGQQEQVRQQLDLLSHQIHNKVGTQYCPNMVIDAVLSEKARLCSKCEIPLSLSVFLPEDLPVEAAHLCSMFSNMLDNAIAATQKTPQPFGMIEVSADIHSNFVTIECSNPSKPFTRAEQRDPMRPHGLGLDILQKLTQEYHGTMHTHWEEGRFHIEILLALPEKPPVSHVDA